MPHTLEAPPDEKHPAFIEPDSNRTTPYKFAELRDILSEADSRFVDEVEVEGTSETYLTELYTFLKNISGTNASDPNISEAKKYLDESLILTEISRVRFSLYSRERSRLSNTSELSRWHGESTAAIRSVLRLYGPEKAGPALQSYWQEQETLFSRQLPGIPPQELKEEFERHKSGVLAAVAFEEALQESGGWQQLPTNAKLDAARAIDYIVRSPDENIFLIQLTSTKSPVTESGIWRAMTAKRPKNISEKEARFWRGVNGYVTARRLNPLSVRAVFLTLPQKQFDPTTGMPSQALKKEIAIALDSIDARDLGWS